jgi:hypothetical protein
LHNIQFSFATVRRGELKDHSLPKTKVEAIEHI